LAENAAVKAVVVVVQGGRGFEGGESEEKHSSENQNPAN